MLVQGEDGHCMGRIWTNSREIDEFFRRRWNLPVGDQLLGQAFDQRGSFRQTQGLDDAGDAFLWGFLQSFERRPSTDEVAEHGLDQVAARSLQQDFAY